MEPNMDHLTEAVRLARSGVTRSVEVFLAILDTHKIFIPIARKIEPIEKVISYYRLRSSITGELVPAVFTDDKLLSSAGEKYGWKTDGEALQLAEASCRIVLKQCLVLCDRQKECVVINPGHETQLELTTEEVFGLLDGNSRALSHRLQRLPIQPGEEVAWRSLSQEELPPNFEVQFRSAVRKYTDFARITFFSVASQQREKPVFVASIKTKESLDHKELLAKIFDSVQDLLPPTFDSMNVMFDTK